ncbi:MAG TPA: glycosyltransferase, partial [Gemmatimonadaceae bacterium]|nr:glycosyltransferase [Gemmatimonadaceae bacterium]
MHNPSNWAVVVPSFNHADDAINCLGSLWKADPRPGRVLLIDDASTDDAVGRIAEWAQRTEIDHCVVSASALQ